jgi:GNAT superfamily N-acetyltransferase
MSHFGEYVKETLGREIVECSYGFATYSIAAPEVYIEDIYVVPEMRKNGSASKLADEIKKRALALGCTYMVGTVNMLAKNPTTSLKVLLAYGFKLERVLQNIIILKMELTNG